MTSTQTMANLDTLRRREADAEKRLHGLETQLTEAASRRDHAGAQLESRRRDLVDGKCTAADVSAASRACDEAEDLVAHLRSAIGTARTEHEAAIAERTGLEHDIECRRQTEASAALRSEAEACLSDVVRLAAGGIHELLLKRAAIRSTIADSFPLAPAVEAVGIEELARRIMAAWEGPPHWRGAWNRSPHGFAFRQWTLSLLLGPVRTGSPAGDLERLLVKE